jgi:hypothetical protein
MEEKRQELKMRRGGGKIQRQGKQNKGNLRKKCACKIKDFSQQTREYFGLVAGAAKQRHYLLITYPPPNHPCFCLQFGSCSYCMPSAYLLSVSSSRLPTETLVRIKNHKSQIDSRPSAATAGIFAVDVG